MTHILLSMVLSDKDGNRTSPYASILVPVEEAGQNPVLDYLKKNLDAHILKKGNTHEAPQSAPCPSDEPSQATD